MNHSLRNFILFLLIDYFSYFWLHWVFVAGCRLFSSCSKLGPFCVVAFLVAEHGLKGTGASVVVAHGLNCPVACGILPDQGLKPCHLRRQADS